MAKTREYHIVLCTTMLPSVASTVKLKGQQRAESGEPGREKLALATHVIPANAGIHHALTLWSEVTHIGAVAVSHIKCVAVAVRPAVSGKGFPDTTHPEAIDIRSNHSFIPSLTQWFWVHKTCTDHTP